MYSIYLIYIVCNHILYSIEKQVRVLFLWVSLVELLPPSLERGTDVHCLAVSPTSGGGLTHLNPAAI